MIKNEAAAAVVRKQAFEQAAQLLRMAGEPILAAELEHGCLHLHPGEPFFVLRAQDVTAAGVTDFWVSLNNASAPPYKINAARAIADAMRRWGGPRKNPD